MKSSFAMKIGGFAALLTTGLLGSVTSATAANVDGCGPRPDGGTLRINEGVCELDFAVGARSWNLPAGITGLHALILGAGGGATSSGNGTDSGYAGAGGDVEYMDLTTSVAGDTITVVVGDGGGRGYQSAAGDGGDSSVSVNGGTPVVAEGGIAGDSSVWGWGFCGSGNFGENVGAGVADPVPTPDPYWTTCVGGGPGIVADSDPDAPAIFDGFTYEVGHGGGVYRDTPHTQRVGDGGSVFVDTNETADTSDDNINPSSGVWGTVIFRYNASEPLAATGGGLPTAFAALASVAIIAAGIGFRPFNRRRSRASR